MPPRYKLSPAFIAMLLNDKSKASAPDRPGADRTMRPGDSRLPMGSAEPDFTPLEEILGERPASVPRPPSRPVPAPVPIARPEPQLNLPTMSDVWRQMLAAKQRAAAYDAIGGARNRAIGGMVTPHDVDASHGFQLGISGGRAASPHDFSSGFPSGKYDELSKPGDLAPDAWSHGPVQRHAFGQGLQFAENRDERRRPPDSRTSERGTFGFNPAIGFYLPNIEPGEELRPRQTHKQIPTIQPRPVPYVLNPKYRAMARAIQMGEGHDYESYNTGTVGDRVVHILNNNPRGTVTGKNIDQILATEQLPQTNRNRLFAFGPYGITFEALRVAKHDMGLNGNELMTPEMQDRIFAHSLIRRDLKRFLDDPKVGIDQAQYSAAHQWASIAVPKGYFTGASDAKGRRIISDGTMSYFGGANSANIDATRELRRVLEGWHLPPESMVNFVRRGAAAKGSRP
jgi:hypothetical protein